MTKGYRIEGAVLSHLVKRKRGENPMGGKGRRRERWGGNEMRSNERKEGAHRALLMLRSPRTSLLSYN